MKFFALIPVAFAGLSALSGVFAQNPQTVIASLKSVTKVSANLNVVVKGTSATNVFTEAPRIVTSLKDIVTTVGKAITVVSVHNPKAFDEKISEEVVEVLTDFVHVHQMLLKTIIGKHGVLAQFGFATPVRLALVAIEKGVDTFAFALIDLIPSQKGKAQKEVGSLDVTLQSSIKTYS
ncbi:hypothetical protein OE88DRAFT_1736963 [Heliocybe sulcata]|uniref:Uncharacterized protein n=1 Tax=Heliocybe sulcata TaxID=5364 RepID=A0A5C3MVZ9_9AGAM|nr:hypothetical protein OE88DRAFT_1736963 [Heliocybe sulcata]